MIEIDKTKSNKMTGGEKAVVAGIGIVTVAGIGYYLASGILNPKCTSPGSACYSALQPYQTEFNGCWTNYITYLNKFVKEDAQAGTGISPEQQSILNTYLTCANSAAKNIAKTAKQYNENPLNVLATIIGEGTVIAIAIIAGVTAAAIYRRMTYNLISVPSRASAATDALIESSVDQGILNPADASGLVESAISTNNEAQTTLEDFYDTLAEEEIITEEVATDVIEEEESTLDDDLDDIIDLVD